MRDSAAATTTATTTKDQPLFSRSLPLWMLYSLFFVAVFLSHWTLLRLPYFWDEGGYYIPAALDFFKTGTLIPQSTVTNAHPPLPSILLAGWWSIAGYVIIGTRTLLCMVTAAALLGVYRLVASLAGKSAALVTALLTAVYPIWFAQSTLAHADMFAAAFTLWALAFYFERLQTEAFGSGQVTPGVPSHDRLTCIGAAVLFSLAALSKETAIVTPAALALWEFALLLRADGPRNVRFTWILALLAPAGPLALWYAYHFHRTGFVFGNPEFLRYNATANLDAHRIALCLYHRFLHLTLHMNMFVPVLCAAAALLMPSLVQRAKLPRPVTQAIIVILVGNWIAFSVLGGALLTRYLLPMYPLVILVCVSLWKQHLRLWLGPAALTAAAFLAAIWINPPYSIAPEDNLTYREMIVLHQRAAQIIEDRWPHATVLTAWPAAAELSRPELGYVKKPLRTIAIQNFAFDQLEKAAQDPGAYDTALIFSTKWEPPPKSVNLGKQAEPQNTKYFDYHHDLPPGEAATLLHGEIAWQGYSKGEWAAVLRFPRVIVARLGQPPTR